MSWLSKIFRSETKGKTDSTWSEAGWTTLFGTDLVQNTDSDLFSSYTISQREKLYKTYSVIFSCIHKVTSALKNAPLDLIEENKSGDKSLPNHPMYFFTDYPNPKQSFFLFLENLVPLMMTAGVAYLWKQRNNAGFPTEIWLMPASYVEPIKNSSGQVKYYEVHQGGTNARAIVDPFDMCPIGFPDPSTPGCYLSPLQSATRDYDSDTERANYIMEMLKNLKSPGLVIKQEDQWTDDQKTEALKRLDDRIGRGKRGNPIFLSGAASDVDMVAPLKDLDWPGLANLSETRLCSVFGVPPILIGLRSGLEHATYSNYETAEKAFYSGTINELWKFLEVEFTRVLLRDELEEVSIKYVFDTRDVLQLQEDANEKAKRTKDLYHGGIITQEEARNMLGLEAPKAGQIFLLPMNLIEVPFGKSYNEAQIDNAHTTEDAMQTQSELNDEKESDSADTDTNDETETNSGSDDAQSS